MEPLAGRVELLEDVFHHARALVHARRPVVLPAALVSHLVFVVLAGDPIVIAAPRRGMHRMDVSAGGIGPPGRAFGRESVGRRSAIGHGGLGGVVVGITRHVLARAVDEELVELQTRRSRCFENAVLVRRPLQLERNAAADHGLAFMRGLVNHWRGFPARIRIGEQQGPVEMINPVREDDGDRFPAGVFARQVSRDFRSFHRCLRRAGLRVVPIWGDI